MPRIWSFRSIGALAHPGEGDFAVLTGAHRPLFLRDGPADAEAVIVLAVDLLVHLVLDHVDALLQTFLAQLDEFLVQVGHAFGQLAKPGLHVPAKLHDAQVRTPVQQLRATAQ